MKILNKYGHTSAPLAPLSPTKLCILVMPAYNEEGCIDTVVRGWLAEFERIFGREFLVIVVNDGSKDRTSEILGRLAAIEPCLQVINQQNSGHGGALLHAYREALRHNPGYVFHVDSDNQFRPADFQRLWDRRTGSPCILGYRSVRQDAFHRLVITRIMRLVLTVLFGRYIKDSNVPFRLLEAEFLRQGLDLIPPTTFAPNVFLAVFAARINADLMHIPVAHDDRKTGTVSIVRWKLIRICFRCVGELISFRGILAKKLPAVQPTR